MQPPVLRGRAQSGGSRLSGPAGPAGCLSLWEGRSTKLLNSSWPGLAKLVVKLENSLGGKGENWARVREKRGGSRYLVML